MVVVSVAVISAIGIVLMFLLSQATNNRELYERNYGRLFGVNIVVAALLLLVIARGSPCACCRGCGAGKFGSRLLVKLAAIFALVGFLPGLLIYAVSYQFVSRSIESWFDVKVEGALDAGLNLGPRARSTRWPTTWPTRRARPPQQLAEAPDALAPAGARAPARAARRANDVDAVERQRPADRQRRRSRASSSIPSGRRRSSCATCASQRVGGHRRRAGRARPGRRQHAPASRRSRSFRSPASGCWPSRACCRSPRRLPPTLVANALAVQEANREYQERALAREGLRRMYIGTLTLSLFLAVFGAVLLAMMLGNQLARPLLLLAAGVREVARRRPVSPSRCSHGKRRARRPDALVRRDDAAAGRRARAVDKSMGQVERARAPTCRRSWTT